MKRNATTVPGFAVKVNNQTLNNTLDWQVSRISIDDQVDLPSLFTLELEVTDDVKEVTWLDDSSVFAIGDAVEIQMANVGEQLKTVISAEVTLVELEYNAASLPKLTVTGYDRRHRLQRGQKVRTFLKKKDSQIAQQIANEAGLTAIVVDSQIQHEYVMQANQTDFDFLRERAYQLHYELVVEGKVLHFRPVGYQSAAKLTLDTENELSEFHAQLSVAAQISQTTVRSWDVKNKKAIVADAKSCKLMKGQSGGAQLVKTFGQAQNILTGTVSDPKEASQWANARFAATALSLIRGEGHCQGRTDLKAGQVVDIKGVGKRFSGIYYITAVNHKYDMENYTTRFTAWRNASL